MKGKKTIISIFLLVMCLTGCNSGHEIYSERSYIATAKGYNGDIKVEVVFEREKMVSISILEESETPKIGDNAIKELPSQIIESQSTDVEAITGATVTSNAIKEAVAACIEQAKL